MPQHRSPTRLLYDIASKTAAAEAPTPTMYERLLRGDSRLNTGMSMPHCMHMYECIIMYESIYYSKCFCIRMCVPWDGGVFQGPSDVPLHIPSSLHQALPSKQGPLATHHTHVVLVDPLVHGLPHISHDCVLCLLDSETVCHKVVARHHNYEPVVPEHSYVIHMCVCVRRYVNKIIHVHIGHYYPVCSVEVVK